MKSFQFFVWKLTKYRFLLNGLIHGINFFIVVFKSDGPVIDH